MRFLQSTPRSLRLAVALLLTGWLCLAAAEAAPALPASGAPAWQVDATHNLCGLTQARQLSSPAQVDLEFGAFVWTEGVNTSPSSDDAKG